MTQPVLRFLPDQPHDAWLKCPACMRYHFIKVTNYQYNGDAFSPDLDASLLVPDRRSPDTGTWVDGKYVPHPNPRPPVPFVCSGMASWFGQLFGNCHCFIRRGCLEFLDDCDHDLRGPHPMIPFIAEELQDETLNHPAHPDRFGGYMPWRRLGERYATVQQYEDDYRRLCEQEDQAGLGR